MITVTVIVTRPTMSSEIGVGGTLTLMFCCGGGPQGLVTAVRQRWKNNSAVQRFTTLPSDTDIALLLLLPYFFPLFFPLLLYIIFSFYEFYCIVKYTVYSIFVYVLFCLLLFTIYINNRLSELYFESKGLTKVKFLVCLHKPGQ